MHKARMPRQKRIFQNNFPYHVTRRTNNRDWFNIPINEVWDIVKDSMKYAQDNAPTKVHAFVLMSNHYHLLISTPKCNLHHFMMYFNRRLSREINRRAKRENHCFANEYKATIVNDQRYLETVYRYIYQNPMRAGLTEDIHSYPYSSLHFSSYEAKQFNFEPHFHFEREKAFGEKRYCAEMEKIIRSGLRRGEFKLSEKNKRLVHRYL
ncbi:transposase [Halobacteriovorax sp. RZ-1]|uniref:REP-associated tyrosine transposase n=2 Tax=Halobacteriovorax TaxID=1652133 RepID=UPI003723CD1E